MEITDVRCVRLTSAFPGDPETFYEDRLARPLDVYGEFRNATADDMYRREPDGISHRPIEVDGELRVSQLFLRIETDEGVTGLAGPIGRTVASLALDLRDLLVGRDPRATEKLWDLMYRREVHGRKGKTMQAISALDVALWDCAGRYYGEPVHRLLGGPTRTELPAYASMLAYSTEPERVRERASEFAEKGYGAQKWFFPHGPGSGHGGIRENVALVEAAREAVGEDYDLMFDCWMSWDEPYARRMFPKLEPYDPRWVEEVVLPDRIDQQAALSEAATFPVAGGEHEYTRWGFHELLSRNALDVLQPDTYWAGGITEMQKITTLGSVHGVTVVPHGHSVPANVQLVAAQSPAVSPLVEYLVKWNEGLQFFFDEPIHPENGVVRVPDRPGIGVDIDDSKVEREEAFTG